MKPLLEKKLIKGIAHITGGGLLDNVPRILHDQFDAHITLKSFPILPIFDYLKTRGEMSIADSYQTFNMGIGLVLITSPENAITVSTELQANNEEVFTIGHISKGTGKVKLSWKISL